ncbi:MAG: hypothetical protein Q9190_005324 [Brigantiaea leucoxantha]
MPGEIREQIYTELLHDESSSFFHLLTVNRQISREIQPYIFKRTITFDGQLKLYDWTKRIDKKLLSSVTDVEIKILDIDPERIVGALGERLRRAKISKDTDRKPSSSNDPYLEACEMDVRRVEKTMRLLGNIKSFSLLPITSRDPRPPKRMMASFVSSMRSFLSTLNLVTLMVPDQVLPFIPVNTIRNLEQLHIVCFSFDILPNVIHYAQHLPQLRKLEICRRDGGVIDQHVEQTTQSLAQFSASKVTTRLPKLRELSLCLFNGSLNAPPNLEKIRETLQNALQLIEPCGQTLRVLRILVDETSNLKQSFLSGLDSFLSKSDLSHAELSCQLHLQLKANLSKSLRSFTIRSNTSDIHDLPTWMKRWYVMIKKGWRQHYLDSQLELKEMMYFIPLEYETDDELLEKWKILESLFDEIDVGLRMIRWDPGNHRC